MAMSTDRARRCAPCVRTDALITAAFKVLSSGQGLSASRIASAAGVSKSLVMQYLYPMHALRQRLVEEAIKSRDPKKLAPLLTWPEAKLAPPGLRRAAALELTR